MPSGSRYQVIHSDLQQTATATTHRSSLCGVCVCAGLELLVDVHVLTTGVQFPGQHFGAAACGGVLLVRFWNSLCGPILLPLEEIMDDYFLTFMCLIPLFFGALAVRSIIDDIKRGKQ